MIPNLETAHVPGYPHPLYFRADTSDRKVLDHTFHQREWHALAELPNVEHILDLGANIGSVTAFLLHHHPHTRAVVVEPDAGNMAVCRRNLEPFLGRVEFVETGVWSAPVPMVVERGKYRDGLPWSYQIRPAGQGEKEEFTAWTVAGLIRLSGFPHVDVLKVDIEGAEAEVFRHGADDWLPLVGTLGIELHDQQCADAVSMALLDYDAEESRSGENHVFRLKR